MEEVRESLYGGVQSDADSEQGLAGGQTAGAAMQVRQIGAKGRDPLRSTVQMTRPRGRRMGVRMIEAAHLRVLRTVMWLQPQRGQAMPGKGIAPTGRHRKAQGQAGFGRSPGCKARPTFHLFFNPP